jgi:hypothetical protein
MTKAQAIETLSAQFNAPYGGTFISALSGDLIQDIMMEGDMGKTFHRFGKTIVEDSSLIGLARYYQTH